MQHFRFLQFDDEHDNEDFRMKAEPAHHQAAASPEPASSRSRRKRKQEANKDYLRRYFQTEKGKEINLRCAKAYYVENREEILRKRREKYAKAKEEALEAEKNETVQA
jgi:hypothetical protein